MNALVVGGTGAVGTAIRQALTSYDVYATSRTPEDSEIKLDMADRHSIDLAVESLRNTINGKLDVIGITVASQPTPQRFATKNFEEIQNNLQTDIINQIYLLKKLEPLFTKDVRVIFCLSQMMQTKAPYFFDYVVSKYATLGILQALQAEYPNMYCSGLNLGMIDSGFIAKLPSAMITAYKQEYGGFVQPQQITQVIKEILQSNDKAKVYDILPHKE